MRTTILQNSEINKELYWQKKNMFTVDGFSDYTFCDNVVLG